MARLTFSALTPVTLPLGAVTGMGRDASNAIQIADESISRHHCLIEQGESHFVLRDLGSVNGTFVNSQRVVGEHVLVTGDLVTFGRIQARFEDTSAAITLPPTPFAGHAVISAPHVPLPASVEVLQAGRQIGAQVPAAARGFLPFDQVQHDVHRLRISYEELRMVVELTRAVVAERDLERMFERVLLLLFQFVRADRGVILLKQPDGTLQVAAAHRREGSTAPIQVSSTILNHAMHEKQALLTPDALQEFTEGKPVDFGRSVVLNHISSAIVVPLIHEDELYGALWLDSQMIAQFDTSDLELVTGVANQAAMFIANNMLSQKIEHETRTRERLSRLLSPNVAEKIIKEQLDVKQGGVFVPSCTVFNSDIRGFTKMSEATPPELMIDMLNEYFERMVEVMFRFEGTLDKFMGDGLMGLWGVPVAHPDDPARSVRCALVMLEELAYFNRDHARRSIPPFQIGIGIHTGPLVAGYVGSSKALSYTVIGDTANTSARLCSAAAPGQILVAESTAALLGSEFVLVELPPVMLKGKEKPVRIFNVNS